VEEKVEQVVRFKRKFTARGLMSIFIYQLVGIRVITVLGDCIVGDSSGRYFYWPE